MELTAVNVNHIGIQDASGNLIELKTMFSTINMEGSSFVAQYDLMPASIGMRPVMAIIATMIRLHCRQVVLPWSTKTLL